MCVQTSVAAVATAVVIEAARERTVLRVKAQRAEHQMCSKRTKSWQRAVMAACFAAETVSVSVFALAPASVSVSASVSATVFVVAAIATVAARGWTVQRVEAQRAEHRKCSKLTMSVQRAMAAARCAVESVSVSLLEVHVTELARNREQRSGRFVAAGCSKRAIELP